ncbi:unnamed protein product [Cuscuta europaea]|uniref:Reverse transcriptase Ty1/copia-type domain-containing protein n=1 Tax=Cuscuta europaea TaxID=41803 RepID=A0A9P1E0E6_CUSEU|nr:unnamed protein product [Cuscuta europaea]
MTDPPAPPHASSSSNSQVLSTSPPPTRPTRQRIPNPKYFGDPFVNSTTRHPIPTPLEPVSVKQALADPRWKAVMEDEIAALQRNTTWTLVPQQAQQPITCKWLFRIKRNADGSVARFKARLVARGFMQQPGQGPRKEDEV